MNQNWKNFLITKNAAFSADGEIRFPGTENNGKNVIFPISSLDILTVSGSDATSFLQGQATCNINDITETKGSFGAFCTPKGRTISTFFIIKQNESYLLVLPSGLLEKVTKKLQLYILRSDVLLNDTQDEFCLFGMTCPDTAESDLNLPDQNYTATGNHEIKAIRFPALQPRFLIIGPTQSAIDLWTDFTENQTYHTANSSDWSYLDVISGIPWLNSETSEEFIPQMINLDQLDGISFNKGCYTGQEIVARTHYLGKSKRKMYLADSSPMEPVGSGLNIIDHEIDQQQSVGRVLVACRQNDQVKMLVVMQIANADSKKLLIENRDQDEVSLSELSY